ncbi:hypothetical protein COLO4_07834, partial [Corchorus olitorius]
DRIKQIRIETPDDSLASWDKDVYSKANGPEKKGRVRCSGAKSSLSNKSGPSCSQSVQHNQEVEGLRTEVHGLKNAVSLLLGAFPTTLS